ncbi:MAG: hypothetical protein GY882_01860 [Actinomycetia bacterium]|nr:hypothetical protein [Actinomycetes bacterium]MCP4845046.1 hypothetical protein [Actinomycetes bacterium]
MATQTPAPALVSHDDFIAYAVSVGVDVETAEAAHTNISKGSSFQLGTSGKFASGKDTVALAAIGVLGAANVDHRSFASDLKSEVGQVIDIVRSATSPEGAVATVVASQGVVAAQAAFVVGLLWVQVRVDAQVNGYSRTTEVRTALQYWGTEMRRAQDEQYWVKRAVAGAIRATAAGKTVIFTDLRYPNEEEALRKAGFNTVRLDVTTETQAQRLWDRDGLRPDPATMAHPSENALDAHEGFTLRFDNDGTLAEAVQMVTALWD